MLSSSERHAPQQASLVLLYPVRIARESPRSEPSGNKQARVRDREKREGARRHCRERASKRSIARSMAVFVIQSSLSPLLLHTPLPHPELHRAHRLELSLHGLAVAEEVVLHRWMRRERDRGKKKKEKKKRQCFSSFCSFFSCKNENVKRRAVPSVTNFLLLVPLESVASRERL